MSEYIYLNVYKQEVRVQLLFNFFPLFTVSFLLQVKQIPSVQGCLPNIPLTLSSTVSQYFHNFFTFPFFVLATSRSWFLCLLHTTAGNTSHYMWVFWMHLQNYWKNVVMHIVQSVYILFSVCTFVNNGILKNTVKYFVRRAQDYYPYF